MLTIVMAAQSVLENVQQTQLLVHLENLILLFLTNVLVAEYVMSHVSLTPSTRFRKKCYAV